MERTKKQKINRYKVRCSMCDGMGRKYLMNFDEGLVMYRTVEECSTCNRSGNVFVDFVEYVKCQKKSTK